MQQFKVFFKTGSNWQRKCVINAATVGAAKRKVKRMYKDATDLKVKLWTYDSQSLTRINNDVYGNPRYVIHFLALLTDEEKQSSDIGSKYEIAVKRANKLIGGRKFHNKQYGGGIVFSSYNVEDELALINALHE